MSTGKSSASPTKADARPNSAGSVTGGRIVQVAGRVLAVLGALTIVVGAALTWARFELLGVEFTIPGVAGWGAVTAALGVLALMQARNLPVVGVILGLAALLIGYQANATVGRAVRQRILGIQQALHPVNDKLMRVSLPPIEPFSTRGRNREHVGPGPLWTFWGGAALAVGSALQFAGGRLRRTCPRCHALWHAERAGSLTFCPACGERVGPATICATCAAPLLPGDHFCAACGASAEG